MEAGLRIENTNGTYDGTVNRDTLVVSPSNATSKYTDVLPSVSLKYEIDAKTNLRAVYGRAIARPNYEDVVPTFQLSDKRKQVSAGNPDLKPTHGQSYDVLFEHYQLARGRISIGGFQGPEGPDLSRLGHTLTSGLRRA